VGLDTVRTGDSHDDVIGAFLDAGDGVALPDVGTGLARGAGERLVQTDAVDDGRDDLVLVKRVGATGRAAEVKARAVDVVLSDRLACLAWDVFEDVRADVTRTRKRFTDLALLEDEDVVNSRFSFTDARKRLYTLAIDA